ncbi:MULTISPECIES: hypothetical protein [Ralstonia]|jgi:hypothetical protein|uniref:Uncharacterized protein n=2 Tax=Ralstonia pickettii TaxID=329 RepID=R0CMC7_RALPI|nr:MULTISPECIES: hypothetical protein [Ralstonia]ENZ77821.1 hypothetical protein OR214_02097 [Ralstonia pickettii OR214]MBL4779336.1 hypothetical protein [Ralstonia sp.]MCM3582078.1 hypothetical protein [Ralstonia pickettii]
MRQISTSPIQATFFFIPAHEQIVREAKDAQEAREREARQVAYAKSKSKKVRSVPEGFDDLDMPLLRQMFAEIFEAADGATVDEAVNVAGAIESGEEWSADAVKWLHALLLERSLELLSMRVSTEEKLDILDWILKPNFFGYRDQMLSETRVEVIDGRKTDVVEQRRKRVRVYQDEIPFTFATCCRVAGLNPEELREQIRSRREQILSS